MGINNLLKDLSDTIDPTLGVGAQTSTTNQAQRVFHRIGVTTKASRNLPSAGNQSDQHWLRATHWKYQKLGNISYLEISYAASLATPQKMRPRNTTTLI